LAIAFKMMPSSHTHSIHQFVSSTAAGDGVTTGVLLVHRLLQRLGYQTTIYANAIDPTLRSLVRPCKQLWNEPPPNILLVHHSMGHEHERELLQLKTIKILLYHNITPRSFFAPQSFEHHYIRYGREQLARWAPHFQGAIGMSAYNSDELQFYHYPEVISLPLLFDPTRLTCQPAEPLAMALTSTGVVPFILSVGRFAANKRQHLLIAALWHLQHLLPPDQCPYLILPGAITSPDYDQALGAYSQKTGLETRIIRPGKVSDGQLRWLYEHAFAYWCLSAHEGFCMPLIEAQYFKVPVIAAATSTIPDTLGQSGLLLATADPLWCAAATAELMEQAALRDHLITAGEHNVQRYHESTLLTGLQVYLNRFLSSCA
jgi:glycosyltransferase involved in cell wall biosynthesis